MITEARSRERADKLTLKKPDWVDFLPKDPTDMGLRFIPGSSNPNNEYSVVISKLAHAKKVELETIEEITVSKRDIDAARKWLHSAHSHIDQHDDERRTFGHTSMQAFIAGVNTTIPRISPVFAFADKSFKEEQETIKQSQS